MIAGFRTESKAIALQTINSAKHKAAGKTHRLVINLHHRTTGAYSKTAVFYVTGEPGAGKIAGLVLKLGGSVSASTSIVNAL